MTPGRLWWLFQRDLLRGPVATFGDYVLRPRIWCWSNPQASQPVVSPSVHVLCGAAHLDLAAWMLASWTVQTGRNWRIVLHDDGTLPSTAENSLHTLGLHVAVIRRQEADDRLSSALATRSLCAAYRRQHPLALKIFDVPVYADGHRCILLDTDVLFFAPPLEMLAWADRTDDTSCWFNADCAEASNVPPEEASHKLGVTLWPRVNSGICLLSMAAIDLDFCERVLGETNIRTGHIWRVEQTLFALCAARHGHGGLLPSTYEVSRGRRMQPGAIARHYVGAVRNRFWGEGVWKLARDLRLS